MMLQRLTARIKSQDWFAVALELAVVIIGIFLGLQADSWNRARIAKADLDDYLQALSQELANTVDIRERQIRWENAVVDGLKLTLGALDVTSLDPKQRDDAYDALVNLPNPPTFVQKTAILREMQAEGMLRPVQNQELRQGLGEIISLADAQQAEYTRYVARISAPQYSAAVVRYGMGADGRVTVVDIDTDAASSDPAFRQQLWQGIPAYQDVAHLNELAVKLQLEVLGMLADEGFRPSENWLLEKSRVNK